MLIACIISGTSVGCVFIDVKTFLRSKTKTCTKHWPKVVFLSIIYHFRAATQTHTHTHTHTPDSVSRQHGGNQPWPCGRFSVSSSPAPVRGLGNDAAAATFPVWGPTGEEKEVGRERERGRC